MMPGNPFVIQIDLKAHLVAVTLFREAGEQERANASLLQAGGDAKELEHFPNLSTSYSLCWHYLNVTGREEAAYDLARKGYQKAENASTRRIYMWSLYEQGQFEKALEVFKRVGDSGDVSSLDAKSAGGFYEFRPFILAELPDGPSRALEAYRENCELFERGYNVLFNQTTLLLLGKREEAKAASAELLKQPEQLIELDRHHTLRIVEYCAGILPEQEYLQVGAGSRLGHCVDHFFVAFDRLSQGDRAGAREHFRDAVATEVFMFTEYQWARLFLKRMEQDPNWPPWIPLKEPAPQPTTTP
jgi:tetratricopeptide (TPR) repeat protein